VTADEEAEESPASPRRCWMEWSWKQGSERRTEAARDVLGGEKRKCFNLEENHITQHASVQLPS